MLKPDADSLPIDAPTAEEMIPLRRVQRSVASQLVQFPFQ